METLTTDKLLAKIDDLQQQLGEANELLEAIRTGQVDALVVSHTDGPALYTLKSADQGYRLFMEKMAAGAVSVDNAGLVLYSNTAFADIIKRPLSRILGKSFLDFVADESRPAFSTLLEKSWTEEVRTETWLDANGSKIPVHLSLNLLELDGGMSMSIIITDLTDLKKAARELKDKNEQLKALNDALAKSNYDLQQFASVASHDLQEPLRKIQVYSKLITDKSTDALPENSKEHLEKILSAAARMKVLILDILSYSGLSADESNFKSVDLKEVVEEVMDDFELKIKEKDAVIEVGPLPVVEGNKGQIRQVLQNLISNGLKFTRPGTTPHIRISSVPVDASHPGLSLENEEAYCGICVIDNGIGFDDKYSGSIFNLFEKLNPKSTFEGSGIGLAIAKKIVDKHNGFIIAKSTEGVGSEFCIFLPLKQFQSHVG